jgi:hypothetical protein
MSPVEDVTAAGLNALVVRCHYLMIVAGSGILPTLLMCVDDIAAGVYGQPDFLLLFSAFLMDGNRYYGLCLRNSFCAGGRWKILPISNGTEDA